MVNKLLIFISFICFGFILHWVPNYRIPLQSDVTWLFRLQVIDNEELQQVIPEALKVIGAQKQEFSKFVISWHQSTGRWNFIGLASSRILAQFAAGNADLMRLFYIIILSSSIAIFYFICQELKIPKVLAILLSLSLFFYPLDIWSDYVNGEAKALLFLILSIYSAQKCRNFLWSTISAIFMTLSALTKENFLIYWVVVLAIVYSKSDLNNRKKYLFPHFISFLILVLYVLYLKINFPLVNEGYVMMGTQSQISPFTFIPSYILQLSSITTLFILVCLPIWLFKGKIIMASIRNYNFGRNKLIISSIISAIILHGFTYYLIGRSVLGRYIIPANYLSSLMIGLFLIPLFKSKLFTPLDVLRKATFNLLVFMLVLFLFDKKIMPHAAQNRIDQTAWQMLIDKVVYEAPQKSHILLKFAEPNMIETAQSLEANTLFRGRYDLTYHLEIEDDKAYRNNPRFLQFLLDSYNISRERLPTKGTGNILYIRADRMGGKKALTDDPLGESIVMFITDPFQYFYHRYFRTKMPYLNFKISLNNE